MNEIYVSLGYVSWICHSVLALAEHLLYVHQLLLLLVDSGPDLFDVRLALLLVLLQVVYLLVLNLHVLLVIFLHKGVATCVLLDALLFDIALNAVLALLLLECVDLLPLDPLFSGDLTSESSDMFDQLLVHVHDAHVVFFVDGPLHLKAFVEGVHRVVQVLSLVLVLLSDVGVDFNILGLLVFNILV